LSEIDYFDTKIEELVARARLGEQVRTFLRSPVGRYLSGRLKHDFEESKDQLLQCNLFTFWGRRKAQRLQRRGEMAQQTLTYLADAIMDGDAAHTELEQEQGE
jgi:hypothetical protein